MREEADSELRRVKAAAEEDARRARITLDDESRCAPVSVLT